MQGQAIFRDSVSLHHILIRMTLHRFLPNKVNAPNTRIVEMKGEGSVNGEDVVIISLSEIWVPHSRHQMESIKSKSS
jgi:hypothetical protein